MHESFICNEIKCKLHMRSVLFFVELTFENVHRLLLQLMLSLQNIANGVACK